MENQELIQAWTFIRQAAENSNGTLAYHQGLQKAIETLAKWMQAKLDEGKEAK